MNDRKDLAELVPDWPIRPSNVAVLCTTRRGGVSQHGYDDGLGCGGLNLSLHVGDLPEHVERNRAIIRSYLPADPLWLLHDESTIIIDADRCLNRTVRGNAVFTCRAGVVCAVLTADALPVLFCDRQGTIVSAVRASWHSLAGGILEGTAAAMRAAGAEELYAWLGAGIGQRKFEVTETVVRAFVEHAPEDRQLLRSAFEHTGARETYIANFYSLARLALKRANVCHISGGGLCTVTNSARFYSYRRDGKTGRQASMIWLR